MSIICLKQVHRKSLKRIWGKMLTMKTYFTTHDINFTNDFTTGLYYTKLQKYFLSIKLLLLRLNTCEGSHGSNPKLFSSSRVADSGRSPLDGGDVVLICYWTCSPPEYSGNTARSILSNNQPISCWDSYSSLDIK
jgi:hypothetical protein